MSNRATPPRRADYAHFTPISTRWSDNDVYRHVNNVVYYGFFDTAVNQQLLEAGVLDVESSPVTGWVVQTQCDYFAPIAFPDRVSVGLRVAAIGTSSVRYELGVFRNDDDTAAASGHFVHVYVERATGRTTPVPQAVRAALAPLTSDGRPAAAKTLAHLHGGQARDAAAGGRPTNRVAATASAADTCARCGQPFHCGMHDPEPCPCTAFSLTAEQLASLRDRFDGCLCAACLAAVSESPAAGSGSRP